MGRARVLTRYAPSSVSPLRIHGRGVAARRTSTEWTGRRRSRLIGLITDGSGRSQPTDQWSELGRGAGPQSLRTRDRRPQRDELVFGDARPAGQDRAAPVIGILLRPPFASLGM